tara:strand:- start:6490 stop:6636 length:147 start_codon:yes stop_codon:yes gene_type:complete
MAEKKITRQGEEYRVKHWTKELTDKKGVVWIVNPNACMKKPEKKKKGS